MLAVFLVIHEAAEVALVEQHLLVGLIDPLSGELLGVFRVSLGRLPPAYALFEIHGHLGSVLGLEVVIELLLIPIVQPGPLKVAAGEHPAHVDSLGLIAAWVGAYVLAV
jgi:hypothetical protein